MVVCTKQLLTVCTRSRQCSSSVVLCCVRQLRALLCQTTLALSGKPLTDPPKEVFSSSTNSIKSDKSAPLFRRQETQLNFFRPRFRFPPVLRQHGGGGVTSGTTPFNRPDLFPNGTLFDDCSPLSGEENLSRGPFAQLSWLGCYLSVWSSSSLLK